MIMRVPVEHACTPNWQGTLRRVEPARAITEALAEAQLSPDNMEYVHVYGTATDFTDRVVTCALKLALGGHGTKIPLSWIDWESERARVASGAAWTAVLLVSL